MAIHDKFVALAKRLIEKHGRLITLRKLSETPADSNKPWRGTQDATTATDDVEITAIALMKGKFEDDGENQVRRGFNRAVVAAASALDDDGEQVDLTNFDLLEDTDGTKYKIDEVTPVMPGGQVILWKLRLKK